ncbi:MAG: DUF2231 domain-containing protein [Candidatus Binataceae bacterium]
MEPVLKELAKVLTKLQLHPIVDHFTVALLIVGVAIDLVSNLAPTRAWIRYMALTLMILGALAAGASYFTGHLEAGRIWKQLGPAARAVLHRHGELGEYLAITFGVLALWRILIESFGFMAGSHGLYQVIAVIAILVLSYSAHLGGELVYTYGAGTALMEATPAPTAAPSPVSASAGPMATAPAATPIASAAVQSPGATTTPTPAPPNPAPTPAHHAATPKPVPAHPTPSTMPSPSAKPSAAASL